MILEGTEKVQQYPTKVSSNPLVSVCVQTYNHENYIIACLDGILMQKTTFDYEILLGEDDSADNTRKICIEYAQKHPDKIRLILHDRSNVIKINNKPTGRYNFLYNLINSSGKYIALCEGDDYWTDENKLQKQFDYLEANPNYTICAHDMKVVNGENQIIRELVSGYSGTYSDLDLAKGNFLHTASVLFKRDVIDKGIPNHFLRVF